MTLYKTETVNITVTDGSINNGTGLSVTVGSSTASQLVFVQGPVRAFTGIAMSPAVTVQVEDLYGNTVPTTACRSPSLPRRVPSVPAPRQHQQLRARDLLLDDMDPDLSRDHAHRRTDLERHRDLLDPGLFIVQRDRSRQQRRPAHRPGDRLGFRGPLGLVLLLLRLLDGCSASAGTLIGTSTGSSPYTVAWNSQPADGAYEWSRWPLTT